MGSRATYRSIVAEAFGLADAPAFRSRSLKKSTVSVTELRCDRRNFGVTNSFACEDAHLIALQLRECPGHDLWFDDRHVRPQNFNAGVTTIYDLRRDPIADIRDPFHSLMFHLPRDALNGIADEAGAPRISDLRYQPGVGIADPVVRQLLLSLRPAVASPKEVSGRSGTPAKSEKRAMTGSAPPVKIAAHMREAHGICDEHGDVASASFLENWIDEAERRVWYLFEASRQEAPGR